MRNSDLKKIMVIIIFLSICPLFLHSEEVLDLNLKTKTTSIDEVKVIGTYKGSKLTNISRVVKIIDSEMIKSIPANSIHELLTMTNAIDIRSRGTMDIQSDFSINGGTFDQIMVLLNGINITDPQTGHFSGNLPINTEDIERIEILEGAGARSQGPNAFTGAVNIVTKSLSPSKIKLDGGDFGLFSTKGIFQKEFNNFNIFSSAGYSKCDGYTANTDYHKYNAFIATSQNFDKLKINQQIGFLFKEFGANAFYSAKYPNQFEKNTLLFASVDASLMSCVNTESSLYFRRHSDKFELFRSNPPAWYKNHNYHLTDIIGGKIKQSFEYENNPVAYGFEFRNEILRSNTMGIDNGDSVPAFIDDEGFYTKYYSRYNYSFFLEDTYMIGPISVTTGFLLNTNSALDYEWNLYPGIDFLWDVNSNLKFSASINKALRMPTFTDLFYNGATNKGNADLKPEKNLTYEFKATYVNNKYLITANSFFRKSSDIIDWSKAESESIWTARNISNVNVYGAGISSEWNFNNILNNKHNIGILHLNYLALYQEKTHDYNFQSYYALDYLRHKLTLNYTIQLPYGFSSGIAYIFESRNGSYTTSSGKEANYKDVNLLNMDIKWNYKISNCGNIALGLNITNITNENYFYYSEVLQPKRWTKLFFEYSF